MILERKRCNIVSLYLIFGSVGYMYKCLKLWHDSLQGSNSITAVQAAISKSFDYKDVT